MKKVMTIIALAPFLLCTTIQAQERQREMRKPPQEAYTACENKSAEEDVTFTTPNGDELNAKCIMIDDELVAVPKDHKPPRNREQ